MIKNCPRCDQILTLNQSGHIECNNCPKTFDGYSWCEWVPDQNNATTERYYLDTDLFSIYYHSHNEITNVPNYSIHASDYKLLLYKINLPTDLYLLPESEINKFINSLIIFS
jgi:hypothetical protein